MLFNLEPLRWIVEGNTAALYRGGISLTQYSEPKQISLRYGEYNEFHYELTKTAVSLYLMVNLSILLNCRIINLCVLSRLILTIV